MHTFRKILLYLVIGIGTLVVLLSLASLVHDVSYWYSKVLDFPRAQYLIVAVVCLIAFAALNRRWKFPDFALVSGLAAAILIQSLLIMPYLVGAPAVTGAEAATVEKESTVGILIANVLITNRKADGFLEIINNRDPDMLLAMEVDKWWMEQLAPLDATYSYSMKYPTENAYGMVLYSKFPLTNKQIKFFNEQDVPSFHTRVQLPSGEEFMFHGMHPVAPIPSKKYPDNLGEKEVAFGKLAVMLADESLPAIVAGDYNDVSWSQTARLFEEAGDLRNTRIGRGLYNTFDAQSPLMRWPLDHFFVSPEFSLLALDRLPEFGSDHFPMYARFVLTN